MLERVIEIDSGLALAYARLSIITFAEYANQWNDATADNLTRALELARKAIETDDTEPQGHIALAHWLCPGCDGWTRPSARRSVPSRSTQSADAYTGLGNIRDFQGRHEDAVALYTRAHRLDPQFDMSLHFLGRALLALGRFDEAEIAFKRRLTLAPRSDMTRFYLACLYGRTGRHDEARRYWRETLEVNPNFSVEHLRRTLPYRDPALLDRLMDGLRNAGIAIAGRLSVTADGFWRGRRIRLLLKGRTAWPSDRSSIKRFATSSSISPCFSSRPRRPRPGQSFAEGPQDAPDPG